MRKNKGITLIEVVIYIALFGVLMSGAIVSAYNLFESSGRNQTKAMIEEEGEFLLGKVGWVVLKANTINLPAINASGNILSVNTTDPSIGTPIIIQSSGMNLTIKRGSNPGQTLNNSNVWLSNVLFTHTVAIGNSINPESVQINFTLNSHAQNGMTISQDFSETFYLHK